MAAFPTTESSVDGDQSLQPARARIHFEESCSGSVVRHAERRLTACRQRLASELETSGEPRGRAVVGDGPEDGGRSTPDTEAAPIRHRFDAQDLAARG